MARGCASPQCPQYPSRTRAETMPYRFAQRDRRIAVLMWVREPSMFRKAITQAVEWFNAIVRYAPRSRTAGHGSKHSLLPESRLPGLRCRNSGSGFPRIWAVAHWTWATWMDLPQPMNPICIVGKRNVEDHFGRR